MHHWVTYVLKSQILPFMYINNVLFTVNLLIQCFFLKI